MPAEIVFSGGEKLRVEELSGSELTQRLNQVDQPGAYLNILAEGQNVWVNPAEVAYVRDA
jgi:hypothetical protein